MFFFSSEYQHKSAFQWTLLKAEIGWDSDSTQHHITAVKTILVRPAYPNISVLEVERALRSHGTVPEIARFKVECERILEMYKIVEKFELHRKYRR